MSHAIEINVNPLPLSQSHLTLDDFLSEKDFSKVQSASQKIEFKRSNVWLDAWNIQTEQAWRSDEIIYRGNRNASVSRRNIDERRSQGLLALINRTVLTRANIGLRLSLK